MWLAIAFAALGMVSADPLALEGTKVIGVSDDGHVVLDPLDGYGVEIKQRLIIPGHDNVSATLDDVSGRVEAVETKTDSIIQVRWCWPCFTFDPTHPTALSPHESTAHPHRVNARAHTPCLLARQPR